MEKSPIGNVTLDRKKRTFDIAFLTGQSENNNSEKKETNNNSESKKQLLSQSQSDPRKVSVSSRSLSVSGGMRSRSPMSSSYSVSSDSDVDVMTNGSLSLEDSEVEDEKKFDLSLKKRKKVRGVISGSKGQKSKCPQQVPSGNTDERKKENLSHFSLNNFIHMPISIPSCHSGDQGHGGHQGHPFPQGMGDFPFPSFLLPHFTKFPQLGQQNQLTQTSQGILHPFSSNQKDFQGGNKSDPYPGGNKLLHPPVTPSPFHGGFVSHPYPIIIPHGQFSPPQQQQHSPPGGHNQGHGHQGHPPTLLPPSLTALTLPAQNVCAKCNIGFRMTSDLVYHMRSHHKPSTFDPLKKQREEKLKCPVCHESFRERHHLTRHMTAHQDRKDEVIAVTLPGPSTGIDTNSSNSKLGSCVN